MDTALIMLDETQLETAAITLCILGIGILFLTLTFSPSPGFGEVQKNQVYITGVISQEIPTESGWLYPVEACEQVTVWTEQKTNHTGLVNITGSKREDFFIADTIKKP